MTLDRSVLLAALRSVSGFRYDTSPGASKDAATTDCSRFAFAVLCDVYGAERVQPRHAELHLNVPASRPWANIEALCELGLGREVDTPCPGWHYCQGWSGLEGGEIVRGSRGHTTLFFQPPLPVIGPGFVLQATPLAPPWCNDRTWEAHRSRWEEMRIVTLERG